jgi:hypothetical protein
MMLMKPHAVGAPTVSARRIFYNSPQSSLTILEIALLGGPSTCKENELSKHVAAVSKGFPLSRISGMMLLSHEASPHRRVPISAKH